MPPTSSAPSTISIGAEDADAVGEVGVEHRHRAGRGDQQRDQAERVGDQLAGALGEPVAEEHAEGRAEQDRGDVHHGADSGKHAPPVATSDLWA